MTSNLGTTQPIGEVVEVDWTKIPGTYESI